MFGAARLMTGGGRCGGKANKYRAENDDGRDCGSNLNTKYRLELVKEERRTAMDG